MRTQLTFLPQKVLPIVKWAGGKRQIIDKLMKKKPKEFSVYFEPFLGGGALLIELYNRGMLKKAVVSDINFDLINLYIVIKTCPEEIIYHIKNMEFKNNSEDYYRARDYYNSIQGIDINSIKEENIIKAALLLYLNRHCYNGLYRVNNKGEFNVPFGSYKNPKLPSREEIFAFSEMLQNIEILHMDFEEAVKNADSFDFVYFDPPYMPISKTAYFTDYTVAGFTEEDQIRLKNVCDILTQKGCYVMVSNSDSEFIRNLYKDYNIETIESRRSINSSAEKKKGTFRIDYYKLLKKKVLNLSPGGRGTRTGRVHENVIEKVLSENYPGRFSKQVFIGTNLFGNKYKADFVLNNNVIISAKWQQKTGTTEQKIVYEIMTLIKILKENNLKEAYIVIGGKGYSRKAKEFYLKQKHIEYIKDGELVEILSLDEFIERANVNKL